MKRLFLILFVSAAPLILSAQSNFEEGFIITNSRDTVAGMINLKENTHNQIQCVFRIDGKSDPVVYQPGDIYGYRVGEKFFVTKTLTVRNPEKIIEKGQYLDEKQAAVLALLPDSIQQTVFSECLVDGLLNLYYYEGQKEKYFFFEEENGVMHALSHKPDFIRDRKIVKDNRYVGMLKYTFQDLAPVAQNADNMKFDANDMISVAKKYHDAYCTTGEECVVFQNKAPNRFLIQTKFSVFAGVHNITYPGDYYYEYALKASAAPMIGAQCEFFFPRMSRNFSIPVGVEVAYVNPISSICVPLRAGLKLTVLPDKPVSMFIEPGISIKALDSGKKEYFYTGQYGREATVEILYFSAGLNFKINKKQSIFVSLSYNYYAKKWVIDRPEKNCWGGFRTGFTF
jgi:hypothetical protein